MNSDIERLHRQSNERVAKRYTRMMSGRMSYAASPEGQASARVRAGAPSRRAFLLYVTVCLFVLLYLLVIYIYIYTYMCIYIYIYI